MTTTQPGRRRPPDAARVLLILPVCLLVPLATAAEPAAPPAPAFSPPPLKLDLKPGPPVRFSSSSTLVETRGAVDPAALHRIRRLQGAAKELVLRESLILGSPDSLRAELAALGVAAADLSSLGPEGYALAVGELPDPDGGAPRPSAVCAATTARGFLHALATLEQALQPVSGTPAGVRAWDVPRLAAVDRPAVPLRGVVEGFTGTPWTPAARLAMIPFLARHKMNFFLHAPADDPHLRTQWRDALPRKVLAHLRDLADACALEQVDVAYGLRPGDTIQYADEEDGRLLAARVDAVRALGIRRFALLFDNLPPDLRYPRDRERFPDPGAAQAEVANRLLARLRSSDPFAKLYLLPAEPWGAGESPYRRSLRERLDPAVEVFWTGGAVVAPALDEAEASAAAGRFGRIPVFWDNYPVNYYAPHRIFLGPVRGRAPAAVERLGGFVANPMALAEASKIALATAADFAWNPRAYDAGRAWAAALAEAAGPDPRALAALRKLAENAQSSWLQSTESPVLSGLLQAAEEQGATGPLEKELAELATVRGTLEETLASKALAAELAPWTARLAWRSAQSHESIALAAAMKEGKTAAVWAHRLAVGSTDRPPGGPGTRVAAVEVCGRLLAAFVARRAEEADRWLGIAPPTAVASSLPAHESFIPRLAADGNVLSAFGSARAPDAGDHVTLDLGRPRPVARVELLQGGPEHTGDYFHDGRVEVSPDGRAWQEIGSIPGPEIEIDLPQPVNARFVRARATKPQTAWLWIREFSASVLDEPTIQTTFPVVPGTPGLDAALDRRAETAFASAGPAPAGAHVTVDLRAPREVTSVAALQSPDAAIPAGRVLLSTDGSTWTEAGALTGAATRLVLEKPRTARYVRVEATASCDKAVRIHEIGIIW